MLCTPILHNYFKIWISTFPIGCNTTMTKQSNIPVLGLPLNTQTIIFIRPIDYDQYYQKIISMLVYILEY